MKVERAYKGYWAFQSETFSVAGTLTVGNEITLCLMDANKKYYRELNNIDLLCGIAQDDTQNVNRFFLYNLRQLTSTFNTQGIQTYVYSASYVVFCQHSSSLEIDGQHLKTKGISINSPYLSFWCRRLITDNKYDFDEKVLNYHYVHPDPMLIARLDNCDVYYVLSYKTRSPQHDGFYNKLESHLKIEFAEAMEFADTFETLKRLERLMSLFMSTPVVSESISFTSGGISCTCIQNIQSLHYHFMQLPDKDAVFTSSIKDMIDGNIIKCWMNLYAQESHALDLFFDSIYNEELSDEIQIICYSSVLEDLTKRYHTTTCLTTYETRKRKFLKSIVDILANDNHKDEANRLKTGYLDKDDTFETRLLTLLHKHQDVWDLLNVVEFAEKAVVTRNFLVHRQVSEKQKPYLYKPQEYEWLARTLRFIISGILLKELGVSTEDITRILCIIKGSIWTFEDYKKVYPEIK